MLFLKFFLKGLKIPYILDLKIIFKLLVHCKSVSTGVLYENNEELKDFTVCNGLKMFSQILIFIFP